MIHNGHQLYNELRELDSIAMEMRRHGVQVDVSKFEEHRTNFRGALEELRTKFAGFGIPEKFTLGVNGQHPSLGGLFFGEFGVKPISYSETTGKPTLDKRALEEYSTLPGLVGDSSRLILKYRKLAKLLSSYIETLPMDSKNLVHPTWRAWGTRTGRWSATDPSLQVIPKKNDKAGLPSLRNLFVPRQPDWWLVEADFKALELRIFAELAQAKKLIGWFAEGVDVHSENAKMIFQIPSIAKDDKRRTLAKNTIFGLLYGGSAETIWRTVVVENPQVKLAHIENVVSGIFRVHPEILEYQTNAIEAAKRNLYVEEVVSGRRQHYHNGRVIPTEVVNFGIQGLAGTLTNRAIKNIRGDLAKSEAILIQCHDAIVLEGEEPHRLAALLETHMAAPIELHGRKLVFPVDVKKGKDWEHMVDL